MKNSITFLIIGLLFFYLTGCNKGGMSPNSPSIASTITIDLNTTFQTIDGFGFYGAYDVWWGNTMWDDAWGDRVISDLGITIWRNQYMPKATPDESQEIDWEGMKPVVRSLKATADKYGVDLKFIFSVWSPPAKMKWECRYTSVNDQQAYRGPGNVSTKNGGTLNPNKYSDFANWIMEGVKLYKDAGVKIYAISLQNEPNFTEPWNSCTYTSTWYNQLLKSVVPIIKASYADVRIFGAESMLEMEGYNTNWPFFYHSAILADDSASASIDILAVHGYSVKVSPSFSALEQMWNNHKEHFSIPMNKPTWMTETSYYTDSWENSGNTPGAFKLGTDIYCGLKFGNISAWIWWQGSRLDSIGDSNLMCGNTCGKKYYVSKQFYRFIRPGAIRVEAESSDPELLVIAFKHLNNQTKTIIIINSGNVDKNTSISGQELPLSFNLFITNSQTENCQNSGTVSLGAENNLLIPAKSIITLQAGGNPL